MAQTPVEKLTLALRLLVGMRRPAVQKALRPHGFGEDTLAQGWRLLLAAGNSEESPETDGPYAVDAELVAFQKRWFPVVRAVLRARLGETRAGKGTGLRVQEGLASGLSVSWFLSQLVALAESDVAEEREVREILRARGLTESVEQAGRALVQQIGRVVAGPFPQGGNVSEGALGALWTWYLEWRSLTRNAVTNKNLLRALGLAPASGRPSRAKQKTRALALSIIATQHGEPLGNTTMLRLVQDNRLGRD
jgi:hypothetical protein